MYVTAPDGLTLTDGYCSCWELTTDLTAPAPASTSWILGTFTATTGVCNLASGLSANKAYGM